MNILYNIKNNEKKEEEVLNLYLKLINSKNNKSKSILFFVENNISKLNYEKKINLQYSEELNITTYLNFVKAELIKFWPIVINKCNKIKTKNISPIFIYNNLSDYIINSKVKQKRNSLGYFNDLTNTNHGISNSINININKAVLGLTDLNCIGEKIYSSKKNKDKIFKFSYSQMNEIINEYIELLLNNGILDNSLSIYIYNEYLLKDKTYQNYLRENYDYLIIDSLESCSNTQVDFIDLVSTFTKDTFVFFNKIKNYSSFNNIDNDYINEKIITKFNKVGNNFNEITLEDLISKNVKIEFDQSSQLYSQMIENVSNKIIDLITNGVRPEDIAIISPVNNTILDYKIKNILNENNIKVTNIKKDNNIIDYPYSNALVVATCIFYDYEDLIKKEEYVSFIEVMFNVNRIKALKIYKEKEHNKDYIELVEYIKTYKNENIQIYEFLIKFYIDKMLPLKDGKKNIRIFKNIIQESETFTENINYLNLDNEKTKEHIFIDVLKNNIKDYYLSKEIEEIKDDDGVIISTPYSFISSNINRQIQLWIDIGSNAWNMKIEKDISNVIVLRKSFDENRIYTDEMEENYKKYYLYNMIYNLLDSATNVYAYKSDYTVNGYMQESMLYGLILKILNKDGKLYE